jgi:hypothetical protein
MNTRQFAALLLPSFILVIFAVGFFIISMGHGQRESTFQKFVDDVRSGKRQMNTELWIDFASSQHALIESEGKLLDDRVSFLRDFGFISLVIAFGHIWYVLSIRKCLVKHG